MPIRTGRIAAACLILLPACGPRPNIPPLPAASPEAIRPSDSDAMLARALAPVLYLQRDEKFQLERVVAVLHPDRPVIAYHLLWQDDVHGAWVPFTTATDQEIIWVGYDSTGAPTDLWTYWHMRILHADWRGKGRPAADIQWGKHGSLPRGVNESDLPWPQRLSVFFALTWLLPDLWLGNVNRGGPWCFCRGFARYREYTLELPLSQRIDLIVRTAEPDAVLRAVFGAKYSEKPEWP